MRKKKSIEDLLESEYSTKVASTKPAPEDPEVMRARVDRALAQVDAENRAAIAKAKQPITDPKELQRAALRLRKELRGE